MVTRYSFSCNECGKEFKIKGFWFNQILLHWIPNYRYMMHKWFYHKRRPQIKYFIIMNVAAIPLLALQMIYIPFEILRWLL